MNTNSSANGHDDSVGGIQMPEKRDGVERRDTDRRVHERRRKEATEGTVASDPVSAESSGGADPMPDQRDAQRRQKDRRAPLRARRSKDATPAPLGYELRLEPRGPGGNRKVTEITSTRLLPAGTRNDNSAAAIDRLARDFHQEVLEHFRQNLPQVQLLRATIDCVEPVAGVFSEPLNDPQEITLRATCVCRRKPGAARKSGSA